LVLRAYFDVEGRYRPKRGPEEDTKMNHRMTVCLTIALAMFLVVALTGCAKKLYRASSQMCVAHGGQYSAETQQCRFTAATTVSAEKACQGQSGVYLAEHQRCEFEE